MPRSKDSRDSSSESSISSVSSYGETEHFMKETSSKVAFGVALALALGFGILFLMCKKGKKSSE